MLSKKNIRKIKASFNSIAVGSSKTLVYAPQVKNGCDYCDLCPAFRLLPDPNPYDRFRDDDMKAVCLEVNGVIEDNLETPGEWTNIRKPLYCPNLGRKLSEEEKKKAQKALKCAKENLK